MNTLEPYRWPDFVMYNMGTMLILIALTTLLTTISYVKGKAPGVVLTLLSTITSFLICISLLPKTYIEENSLFIKTADNRFQPISAGWYFMDSEDIGRRYDVYILRKADLKNWYIQYVLPTRTLSARTICLFEADCEEWGKNKEDLYSIAHLHGMDVGAIMEFRQK